MNMNWLESILYGFLSGLSEFMPVSSQAHQTILLYLFGETDDPVLLRLFVRVGVLAALLYASRTLLKRLQRELQLKKVPKRRRRRQPDPQYIADISFVKTACILLLVGFAVRYFLPEWHNRLELNALFLALNGIILHLPLYMNRGNKDSRSMSALDATFFGFGAALSVLPGVSRVGAASSLAVARGADMQQAYKWSLLISIPAITGWMCFDVYALFATGFGELGFLFLMKCIISCMFAFAGASTAIASMKFITVRLGLSGFSYYSWGAALFAFILYLT